MKPQADSYDTDPPTLTCEANPIHPSSLLSCTDFKLSGFQSGSSIQLGQAVVIDGNAVCGRSTAHRSVWAHALNVARLLALVADALSRGASWAVAGKVTDLAACCMLAP